MDPSKVLDTQLEQDWDADDFEIPSLKPEKEESRKAENNGVKKAVVRKEKADPGPIYLGPHGAPPSQLKQQELNTATGKKNKRKQKLKDTEKKGATLGRENKVDTLRDLMGSKGHFQSPRGTQSDWLDPHCHESQFERLA
ncbi:hypothetical protein GOP47_0025427 [Adiantum capillus-veneris]|uniref:Uncharacterized protein n=1 Tax=Adiantum capillus-veneris TaxID=13818 RepID=A0A9D4Z299_ADICA|nr:hypothetical protein GOP47_0025427 [Adiantum capillus-veneris]